MASHNQETAVNNNSNNKKNKNSLKPITNQNQTQTNAPVFKKLDISNLNSNRNSKINNNIDNNNNNNNDKTKLLDTLKNTNKNNNNKTLSPIHETNISNRSQTKKLNFITNKIPKNVNEYQHLISIGSKEDTINWMINLRQSNPEFKQPTSQREPSFYLKDLENYSNRVSKSKNLNMADPIKTNIGGLNHLFKNRPGEKANLSQQMFETSLRKFKLLGISNNKHIDEDKNLTTSRLNKSSSNIISSYYNFYKGNIHMTNKPGYFSTVYPACLNISKQNIKKLQPISKCYDVKMIKEQFYKDTIVKKQYNRSEFGNVILGEHYSAFNDKCSDTNVGNRSQLFENRITIGEKSNINWATSLRFNKKHHKSFSFNIK